MAEENSAGPKPGKRGRPALSAIFHPADSRIALLILTGCGALYYMTSRFEEVPDVLAQNIPARWFPRLLIWIIAALALLLPLEHRFRLGGTDGLDEDRAAPIAAAPLITAGLLCALVGSIHVLGIYPSMILTTLLLPLAWGERRWKWLIPYAILFPGAVTLVFNQVLKVYFEPGLLPLLWK